MDSGLHGSGIMSSGPNTADSSTMRRRISESTTRSRSLSKFSLRPASCTGWKVTPRPYRIENGKEIRMQGRLAARQLHQVGLAFARDQRIEHPLDGGERQLLFPRRRGFREADRAGQVAVLVDLDQRQAGMLLVVGAEPAIVGATVFGMALPRQRAVARLEIILAELPIGGVGGDAGGLGTVLRTALLVPDLVVANLDLGRDQLDAGLAQRGGLAPEQIGTRSTQKRGHRPLSGLGRLRS